jgi:hypothetical protein
VTPFPVNVIPPVIVTGILYSFFYWIPEVAAKAALAVFNGPRILAVTVSVAYVILSTVETGPGRPPPNHPSVALPVAAGYRLAEDSGPRTLAVAVSVAYVILSILEILPAPGK